MEDHAGIILVHHQTFFALHQAASKSKIRHLSRLLITGGMMHLAVGRYSKVREFHKALMTYIIGSGRVGDLLSLALTSSRTLQLLGSADEARRSMRIIGGLLRSEEPNPSDILFFERDSGLLTWVHDREGEFGQSLIEGLLGGGDIGGVVRGGWGEEEGQINLPGLNDGRSPIGGILNGLGAAGDCVEPFKTLDDPSFVKIDKKSGKAGFDLKRLEQGGLGDSPCVSVPKDPGWDKPGKDPDAPPGADPNLKTQKDFDDALNKLLGEPDPPLTKEEQDELLATPAPEPSEPQEPRTTPEDIDKMLGNTPKPDDDNGPKGPAYYPQPDGGGRDGGPAGRFYYPSPDGDDSVNPRWRFFYPNPDDIGPGGPAGRSRLSAALVEKSLRAAVAGQQYFPQSGSVFLPQVVSVWSKSGIGAELIGTGARSGASLGTFLLRIGNGGASRLGIG